jgi:hypothetical protein
MSNCDYVYDALGLRWRDDRCYVRLLVDGDLRVLHVVRNGSGASRIDRFSDGALLHPLGGTVFGEVTARDLERILRDGSVEVLVDGRRVSVSRTPEDTDANSIALEVIVDATAGPTSLGSRLVPSKAGGGGRLADTSAMVAAIESLGSSRATRAAVALAQFETMPKSGRAGGPAARARLRACISVLLATGRFEEIAEAFLSSPDAALHMTPACYAELCTHDESLARAVTIAVEASLADGAATAPLAVMAACRVVCRSLPASRPVSDPVAAGDPEIDLAIVRSHVLAAEGASREGFEILASDTATVSHARDMLVSNPERLLDAEMAVMLMRLSHNPSRSPLLTDVLRSYPTLVLSRPEFGLQLGEYIRESILQAPLAALRSTWLPLAEQQYAAGLLEPSIESGDPSAIAEIVGSLENTHPQVSMRLLRHLSSAGVAVPAQVRARVELSSELCPADAGPSSLGGPALIASLRSYHGLRQSLETTSRRISTAVSECSHALLDVSRQARRLLGPLSDPPPREFDAVRLRGLLRSLATDAPRMATSIRSYVSDMETNIALLLEEFMTLSPSLHPATQSLLYDRCLELRSELNAVMEQIGDLRYPDALDGFQLRAIAARAQMLGQEMDARVALRLRQLLENVDAMMV